MSSKNILCIDDEKGVRDGVKFGLDVPGENIFDNYKEGIERLTSPDFLCDLVITDLSANPADFSRNGTTVLDAAVATHDDLPCIVYTGNAEEKDNELVNLARTYPHTTILWKPSDLNDLRGLVSDLLQSHNPKRKEKKQPYIFVVEDDPFIPQLLKIFFDKNGFSYQMESNCRASLPKIIESKPDLLLMDVMNQSYHGDDLLDALLLQGYKVPTIVMSGTPNNLEVKRSVYHAQRMLTEEQRQQLGMPLTQWPDQVDLKGSTQMPYFLLKPFDLKELSYSIGQVLEVTE